MDRSSKQKRKKEIQALNDTVDQIDLIDIYRTFYPKVAEYTFLSSPHGTFSRIDHILGHKSSLSKFKEIEIISSIFSEKSSSCIHKCNLHLPGSPGQLGSSGPR